jgi:hypothetical protein
VPRRLARPARTRRNQQGHRPTGALSNVCHPCSPNPCPPLHVGSRVGNGRHGSICVDQACRSLRLDCTVPTTPEECEYLRSCPNVRCPSPLIDRFPLSVSSITASPIFLSSGHRHLLSPASHSDKSKSNPSRWSYSPNLPPRRRIIGASPRRVAPLRIISSSMSQRVMRSCHPFSIVMHPSDCLLHAGPYPVLP